MAALCWWRPRERGGLFDVLPTDDAGWTFWFRSPESGTDYGGVIGMDQFEVVSTDHRVYGKSIREIPREAGRTA